MIDLLFQFGPDIVLVKIQGNNVSFGSTSQGAKLAPIDSLKLNRSGVIRQFPDLKNDNEWRSKAITRFKNHIAKMRTERQRAEYIIQDLKKHGYTPKKMQIAGHRPINIK